jgi:hypothetical protein
MTERIEDQDDSHDRHVRSRADQRNVNMTPQTATSGHNSPHPTVPSNQAAERCRHPKRPQADCNHRPNQYWPQRTPRMSPPHPKQRRTCGLDTDHLQVCVGDAGVSIGKEAKGEGHGFQEVELDGGGQEVVGGEEACDPAEGGVQQVDDTESGAGWRKFSGSAWNLVPGGTSSPHSSGNQTPVCVLNSVPP